MRIGRLDRRITLQSKTAASDPAGEPIETWSTIAEVWARVQPMRGDERFAARQIVGAAVTTFTIRWRAEFTVINRILYDGKTWDVKDVRELGRREGLEIDATAPSDQPTMTTTAAPPTIAEASGNAGGVGG